MVDNLDLFASKSCSACFSSQERYLRDLKAKNDSLERLLLESNAKIKSLLKELQNLKDTRSQLDIYSDIDFK